MGWWVLIPIFAIFMIFAPAILIPMSQQRRKFLLEMKREETKIAQARAKELELHQRRAELEYREALLELEKYDRRTGRASGPLPPELYPPAPGSSELPPLGPSPDPGSDPGPEPPPGEPGKPPDQPG